MVDVGNQRLVPVSHGLPVDAVHAGRIEELPHLSPAFLEDLGPLGPAIEADLQAGQVQLVLDLDLGPGQIDDGVGVLLRHQHLLVVGRRDVGSELAEGRLLPLLEVIHEEEAFLVPGALAGVVDPLTHGGDPAVARDLDGQGDDAVLQALDVDLDLDGLLLFFLFLLLVLILALVLFLLDLHLVAPGLERRLDVPGQGHQVDPGHVLVGVIPLRPAVDGPEIPAGNEEEELAVGAERGPGGGVPALGHRMGLARLQGKEIDPGVGLLLLPGIGDPLAVRRPGVLPDLPPRGRSRLVDGLGLHVHVAEPHPAVAPEQLLRVGRPGDLELVGLRAAGDADGGFAPVLGHDVDLVLPGGVGEEGDPLSVRGPGGVPLVYARGGGQHAGGAVLGRNREDLAPGAEQRPLPVGRNIHAGHLPGHVDQAFAGGQAVVGDGDAHLLRLFRGQVEAVDEAAVLVHDGPGPDGGELDVEVGISGKLPRLPGIEVMDEEVHAPGIAAVGQEIDPVPAPHGDDVLGRVGSDVLDLPGAKVKDPHVVRHAPAVLLPGAELAKDPVVGHLPVVGGEGAEAAPGHRDLFGQPAFGGHEKEGAVEAVEGPHAGPECDLGLAVLPGHDDVVGAHAVGHVVAAEGCRVRETAGDAAGRRYEIDLGVAVVLAGEGNGLAVRGEPREHLVPGVAGHLPRHAAPRGDRVEVSGVREHDVVPVDGGEPEESGFGLGQARHRGRKHQQEQDGGGSSHLLILPGWRAWNQ